MKLLASLLAAVSLSASAAHAAIVQHNFAIEYSGATAPVGSPAWLTVKLDDGGSAGSVTMTVTAANLTSSEFVTKLLLNLDPLLNASSLSFSSPTKVGTFASPTFSKGTNAFSAGGGSNFDIEVLFDNSPPSNRFGAGESMTTVVSGIPSLTANSFSFNSVGGSGSYPIAAHVQGIGTNANLSGWVTTLTPEPMSLSAFAAAGLVLRRRR